MSRNLLLEIGTEEIPAHAMPGLLKDLEEKAEKGLKDLRLTCGQVKTMGTPRRLALLVEDLAEKQEERESSRRGPAAAAAFDADGNPTKAAQGFARGQKVESQELIVKDGYVYAVVREKGEETTTLLAKFLPELIGSLSLPNSMRWADYDFRFIRPIRWLAALFGEEVIPFELAAVKSGRTSRGHRFLTVGKPPVPATGSDHEHAFEIAKAEDYEAALAEHFVIVDQEKRKAEIRKQIEAVAANNGGQAEITEELLEEVLYLVEYPTALCGKFDEEYLKLPPEAVITPMRDHQRYFPVKTAEGKLMPLFITVRNGGKEFLETVTEGNERVLKARLEDAKFFFDEDRQKKLEEHREKLKTVVFQEGLGTVYEKTERLKTLAGKIADALGATAEDKADSERAALLAKADLVTGMVTEFTELQGTMGRDYARLDGEKESVAIAIDEHYRPRFAGDKQPGTMVGRILSLADKIDNIVGTFSRGKIPSGSQDPFALRRQALGIVNMLTEAKLSISLKELTAWAMDLYGITDETARAKMQQDVADFMKLRLKNLLEGQGIRYDVSDAVLVEADDCYAVTLRAAALTEFLSREDGAQVTQAFVRVANLARKYEGAATFDADIFALPAEKTLGEAVTQYEQTEPADYAAKLRELGKLTAPINGFFDAVMVMDKNEKIRQNRLGLLKVIDGAVGSIADFTKVVLQ